MTDVSKRRDRDTVPEWQRRKAMEENRNTQGMNMEDRLAALEKELMGNRRIDPNLYAEYDV